MDTTTLVLVIILLVVTNIGTWAICERQHWNCLKYTGLLAVHTAILLDECGTVSIKCDVRRDFQKRFVKLTAISERYRERFMESSSTRD